jgi:hypothetical protein
MTSQVRLMMLAANMMLCLGAQGLRASEGCDPGVSQEYRECLRIADSLRPDKPGEARVFAADGSEFTAGQAQWMKGRLRLVAEACAHGDQAEAQRLLQEVQRLIQGHHVPS